MVDEITKQLVAEIDKAVLSLKKKRDRVEKEIDALERKKKHLLNKRNINMLGIQSKDFDS